MGREKKVITKDFLATGRVGWQDILLVVGDTYPGAGRWDQIDVSMFSNLCSVVTEADVSPGLWQWPVSGGERWG